MASYGSGDLEDFSLRWGPERSSKRKLIKDSKVHKQEITFHTDPSKAFMGKPKSPLLSDFELEECKEAFGMFDTGDTGTIQAADLDKALRILDLDPTRTEVRALMSEKCDEETKSTGAVSFSEFITLVSQLGSDTDDDEDLREAFVMLDPHHTGSIDKQKMKTMMTQLGHELSEEDIEGMIKEADHTGDGRVSFQEFCRIMNASH